MGQPSEIEVVSHEEVVDDTNVDDANVDDTKLADAGLSDVDRYESKIHALLSNKKPAFWCAYMLFTIIMWGYDGLASGIVLSMEQFRKDFGQPYEGDYVLPAKWQLAFTAASTIGLLIGGPPATFLAKRWGRRAALAMGYVFTVTGVFLQFYADGNLPMFFGSKLMTGLPLGMFVTIAPTYCAEVAPFRLRGVVTAATNWCICLGQLIGYAVLKNAEVLPGNKSYRTLFAVQWGFAAVAVMFLPFLPESPYFFVAKGDVARSKTAITKLYGADADIDKFLARIDQDLETAKEQKAASFAQCFDTKNWRRTVGAVSLFAAQQNSGCIWVLGYMTYFLILAGVDAGLAFNVTFGLTGAMLAGNMISWLLVDRAGRRVTAVVGLIVLSVTLILVGVMAVIPGKGALWALIAFLAVWSVVYQATIGSLAWTVATELPTSRLRTHTQALCTAMTGVTGTAWSFVLPYIVNPDEANLGGKAGFIFGSLLFLSAIMTWFFVPETKGRSFAEIDALYEAKIKPWNFKKTEVIFVGSEATVVRK